MRRWSFTGYDTGGSCQQFRVMAASKQDAVKKAFNKANKKAHGEILIWCCIEVVNW